MRTVYRFTPMIPIILAMFVSPLSLAQQHIINMHGGPLKKADWMKNPAEAPLNEDHSDNKNWITKWLGPDGNYENSGGAEVSAPKDLIEEGTKGHWKLFKTQLTQSKLSTRGIGVTRVKDFDILWGNKHGGPRRWTVFELDPADAHHMKRNGPIDNIDTYAICVIEAPEDMTSVMSPAHDDHAQIWINGKKWYNNALGTEGPMQVDYNIEIVLRKGVNFLVYRCSQSDGPAYMNLHFDDNTHKICDIYPQRAWDLGTFFGEFTRI